MHLGAAGHGSACWLKALEAAPLPLKTSPPALYDVVAILCSAGRRNTRRGGAGHGEAVRLEALEAVRIWRSQRGHELATVVSLISELSV